MPATFLTARWSHLALVTWVVPPALVEPRLPPGCTLDLVDGQAFASLVAFDFLDTRVLGIAWPGFRRFPEVNLRFYVRRGERRGVAFVRELVPSRLVACVARALYNEPYAAARMTSRVDERDGACRVRHEVVWRGRRHGLEMRAPLTPVRPAATSREHFFKEHDTGWGRTRGGRLVEYAVEHPVWEVLPEPELELDWDLGQMYGDEWAVLAGVRPHSLVLALGSQVSVSRPRFLAAADRARA